MKRFILPLLLLLLVGSIFAVESDPSAVVGYMKYGCVPGLNFVALPMEQGYTLTTEIGDEYQGKIDAISQWNASIQNWDTAVYYEDFEMWDPEFEATSGDVFMINALVPFDFYSIGEMPAQNAQYSLLTGLNSVMIPLNRSDVLLTSDLGNDVGSVDAVSIWNAAIQNWDTTVYYEDFEMWDPELDVSIGMPLMINVITPSTWPSGPRSIGNSINSKSK